MQIEAMTWNLFHGRDWPPEPELQVSRLRLAGRPIKGERFIQVNRDLLQEFARVIATADWNVALFQECPPPWRDPLARAAEAEHHRVLTSRNSLLPLTGTIGRIRPDLLGASAGGSNLTLVRPAAGRIVGRERLVLSRRLERRMMALTRLDSGICVANLHASTTVAAAERELLAAAARAVGFAGDQPLVLGGDFNVRPRESAVYDQLAERYDLAAPTSPDRIDHLLVRGLEVGERPAAWRRERRDIEDEATGLSIRLSDHDPVEARFTTISD